MAAVAQRTLREEYRERHRQVVRAARINPNIFIEYCMGWEHQWFHREWQDLLSRHSRVLILAPKDHGKTSQLSVARTIFELGGNANLRIKIVTNSDGKSTDILTEISGNIKENDRIHEVFPKLKIPMGAFDNKSKLTIERPKIMKDPSIEAIGIMTSGSSSRADQLVGDDVCNFRNSILEPGTREMLKKIWDGEFIGQLEPDGSVRYICTPWHGKDLTAKLKKLSVYLVREYEIGENYQPIWPNKWGREYLISRWKELGDEEYDRQFRNKVISEGARAISAEAIRQLRNYGVKDMAVNRIGVGIDPGMMRLQGAKSSIFVLGYKDTNRDGTKMIPKEIREGLWTAPQLVREIKDVYKVWQPDSIKVESNAFQMALAQWLEDDTDITIRIEPAFTSAQKKQGIETGIKGMGLSMERGQWILPLRDHKEECRCTKCMWVRQLEEYPYGERDDMVMASWICSSGEWRGRPRIRSI